MMPSVGKHILFTRLKSWIVAKRLIYFQNINYFTVWLYFGGIETTPELSRAPPAAVSETISIFINSQQI